MDLRQTGLGIVLFVAFWAFQVGKFESLGPAAWLLGAIVFAVVLWMIGKGAMPKPSADMQELWKFATLFVVLGTIFAAYLAPYAGAVMPPGATLSAFTPMLLGLWLAIFGGAMVVTGWQMKWGVTLVVGLLWLVSAVHLPAIGPNAYIHFAVVTGFPFIIYGLILD